MDTFREENTQIWFNIHICNISDYACQCSVSNDYAGNSMYIITIKIGVCIDGFHRHLGWGSVAAKITANV